MIFSSIMQLKWFQLFHLKQIHKKDDKHNISKFTKIKNLLRKLVWDCRTVTPSFHARLTVRRSIDYPIGGVEARPFPRRLRLFKVWEEAQVKMRSNKNVTHANASIKITHTNTHFTVFNYCLSCEMRLCYIVQKSQRIKD